MEQRPFRGSGAGFRAWRKREEPAEKAGLNGVQLPRRLWLRPET